MAKEARTYGVLGVIVTGSAEAELALEVTDLKNKQQCLRWIKDNGMAGKEYQPVAFLGDLVIVQCEIVEKRTVMPVPDAQDLTEEPSEG